MNKQRLLSDAKTIVLALKNEEQKMVQNRKKKESNITPYASFSGQIIVLINNGNISKKEDIRRLTKMLYARPRMNHQWRTFGNVLEKNLRTMDKNSLLYLFGFLKRVLTIEGKKQNGGSKKHQKGGQGYKGKYPGSKKRKHHYKHQR